MELVVTVCMVLLSIVVLVVLTAGAVLVLAWIILYTFVRLLEAWEDEIYDI